MPVAIQKLAEECGLARTTVRNILSSSKGAYSEETRQRVLAAAQRHGYYPSRLPKLLRERSASAVGLIFPNLTDPYVAELLDMFTRELVKLDLEVMVGVPHWKSHEEARKVYHSFLSWHLRAFLVATQQSDIIDPEDFQQIIRSTVMISLNGNPWPECCAVYPDRELAAKLAVKHLVDLGHRRIGQLAYSPLPDHVKTQTLKTELTGQGLTLLPQDIWTAALPDSPEKAPEKLAMDIFDLGRKFARTPDRPTAMVAWSESLACRFISGFLAEGGRVPRDLSVVTYNQTQSFGMIPVPLTAVGVPIDRFVETTLALMLEALAARKNEENLCRQIQLEPKLRVRQSTGPTTVLAQGAI